MVELHAPHLDTVFHALGDATRRRMLRELSAGERTVSQLAEPFAISLAAASKHIKVLENAGMIRREVRGRTHLCRLDPGPLAGAHEWLIPRPGESDSSQPLRATRRSLKALEM
jgi:DNA-binding transcriptional ArsR family regulator